MTAPMTLKAATSGVWRRAAALFALCALLLRAWSPPGFMPATAMVDASGFGAIPIVLCTGAGSTSVWLADDGTIVEAAPEAPDHDPGGPTHADCVFAHGSGALPAQVRTLALAGLAAAAALKADPIRDLAPGRGLAAPPPPATAPPIPI
jgi:hypothetical protein